MSEKTQLEQNLDDAARFVRELMGERMPKIGLILGSGLNPLANDIEDAVCVSYRDVPHMKASTVGGHVGRFVCGTLAGVQVIAMQGRLHGYEGNTSQEVVFPVRLMHRLGVETLIVTNTAGGINESYREGDFCIMADQINFTGRNPIADAQAAQLAMRFFSMTDAFDPSLRALARKVAEERGIRVQEGVYLGLLGPSFETPAEIRAFRSWGADTVAMSVVEEVIAARHVGMRVLGISLVSNMAAGIGAVNGVGGVSPSGAEVADVARNREGDFARLITGIMENL